MKNKTVFFCSECGNESSKWTGKCMACGSWNTMIGQKVVKSSSNQASLLSSNTSKPKKISEIEITDDERTSTGIKEFDRVLGGGIVKGSLVLVGGDPGIGKSTLLLQMCQTIKTNSTILYASGEESQKQIKLRAERLNVSNPNLLFLSETNMIEIENAISSTKPDFLIIDSVQTIFCPNIESAPGSVTQIREVTLNLMKIAKTNNISIFLVGHVTKEGTIAGPKILEHMVDCVLYFEGESHHFHRILRGVKNRFGSTNEIGVFEMNNTGLCEIENPSKMLLSETPVGVSGTTVTCTLEGTRPILAEIQALTTSTNYPSPKRTASGIDYNKMALIIAVLEKHTKLKLSTQDIYVNVAGGMKLTEPAIDLSIAAAIASSLGDFIIPSDTVAIGEIGLTGEIRSVTAMDKRINEAEKLGFKRIIVPYGNRTASSASINIIPVKNIGQALSELNSKEIIK